MKDTEAGETSPLSSQFTLLAKRIILELRKSNLFTKDQELKVQQNLTGALEELLASKEYLMARNKIDIKANQSQFAKQAAEYLKNKSIDFLDRDEIVIGLEDFFNEWQQRTDSASSSTHYPPMSPKPSPGVSSEGVTEIPYEQLTHGKFLGRGAYGEVYLARWQGKEVAVKKLLLGKLTDKALDELGKEAKILSRADTPYVVKLYGLSTTPPNYCLVLEYCKGGSLKELLHSHQEIQWPRRWQIARRVAHGLVYLHGYKIIHRDLKSDNVLLDDQGQAKLTDFGLAEMKTLTRSSFSSFQTKRGKALGALGWFAPELLVPGTQYQSEVDVYSFGVLLWEIASRKMPFDNMLQAAEVLMAWIRQGYREKIPEDTPPRFARLIEQCWKGNPKERPTAEEALKRLINPDPEQQLIKACEAGNLEEVQRLIAEGVDPSKVIREEYDEVKKQTKICYLALEAAAKGLHLELVYYLEDELKKRGVLEKDLLFEDFLLSENYVTSLTPPKSIELKYSGECPITTLLESFTNLFAPIDGFAPIYATKNCRLKESTIGWILECLNSCFKGIENKRTYNFQFRLANDFIEFSWTSEENDDLNAFRIPIRVPAQGNQRLPGSNMSPAFGPSFRLGIEEIRTIVLENSAKENSARKNSDWLKIFYQFDPKLSLCVKLINELLNHFNFRKQRMKFINAILKGDIKNVKWWYEQRRSSSLINEDVNHRIYPLVAAAYSGNLETLNYVEKQLGNEAGKYWRLVDLQEVERRISQQIPERRSGDETIGWLEEWYEKYRKAAWCEEYDRKILGKPGAYGPYWESNPWRKRTTENTVKKDKRWKSMKYGDSYNEAYLIRRPSPEDHDEAVNEIIASLNRFLNYVRIKFSRSWLSIPPPSQERQNTLVAEILKGNVERVKLLHSQWALLTEPDSDQLYPLVVAAYSGDRETLNYVEQHLGEDAEEYWSIVDENKVEERIRHEMPQKRPPNETKYVWLGQWYQSNDGRVWCSRYDKNVLKESGRQYWEPGWNSFSERAAQTKYRPDGVDGRTIDRNRHRPERGPGLFWPSAKVHDKVVNDITVSLNNFLNYVKTKVAEYNNPWENKDGKENSKSALDRSHKKSTFEEEKVEEKNDFQQSGPAFAFFSRDLKGSPDIFTYSTTLNQNAGEISCFLLYPDGRLISGSNAGPNHSSNNNVITLWDLQTATTTQKLIKKFDYSSAHKFFLLVHPNNKYLISGFSDGAINIWDLYTGSCQLAFNERPQNYHLGCLIMHPDGKLIGSSCGRMINHTYEKIIKVWDLATGQCIQTLGGGQFGNISHLQLHSDGITLVSTFQSNDAKNIFIHVWDLKTGKCTQTLKEHTAPITFIKLYAHNQRLMSSSSDCVVKIWDTKTWQCILTFNGLFHHLQLHPNGKHIAGVGKSKNVELFDLESGQCTQILKEDMTDYNHAITCLHIHPNGKYLINGHQNGMIKVWDLESGACIQILKGVSRVNCLQLDLDGNLISGHQDGRVALWKSNLEFNLRLEQFSSAKFSSSLFNVKPTNRKKLTQQEQQRQGRFIAELLKGNFEKVKELHQQGALLTAADTHQMYPLVAAAYSGNLKILKYIEDQLGEQAEYFWSMVDENEMEQRVEAQVPEKRPYHVNTYSWLGAWYEKNQGKNWCNYYDTKVLQESVCVGWRPGWNTFAERCRWTQKDYLSPFGAVWRIEQGGYPNTLVWPSAAAHDKVVNEIIESLNQFSNYVRNRMAENKHSGVRPK